MKYTAQSTKYVFKNLFYILPLVVLPAFLLAFTLARAESISVFTKVAQGRLTEIGYVELFQTISIFNFSSWESVLFGAFGFLSLVVCVSMLMAFTEKHMRIGKRTLNGLFGKLNDNLLSTLGFTVLLFAVYELWSVISAALFLLVTTLPLYVAYGAAIVLFFAVNFALLYVVSTIYLWLPCMQITGFKPFEALRYAYILCEPVRGTIILAQTLFFAVAEVLITGCIILLPKMTVLSVALNTLLFAYMIMLFCVRMQIVYFDRAQIERADLRIFYW